MFGSFHRLWRLIRPYFLQWSPFGLIIPLQKTSHIHRTLYAMLLLFEIGWTRKRPLSPLPCFEHLCAHSCPPSLRLKLQMASPRNRNTDPSPRAAFFVATPTKIPPTAITQTPIVIIVVDIASSLVRIIWQDILIWISSKTLKLGHTIQFTCECLPNNFNIIKEQKFRVNYCIFAPICPAFYKHGT